MLSFALPPRIDRVKPAYARDSERSKPFHYPFHFSPDISLILKHLHFALCSYFLNLCSYPFQNSLVITSISAAYNLNVSFGDETDNSSYLARQNLAP